MKGEISMPNLHTRYGPLKVVLLLILEAAGVTAYFALIWWTARNFAALAMVSM
jgi:hypothetical protein